MPRKIHTYNDLRICSQCKIAQNSDNFYNEKRASDGKQSKCKKCCSINASIKNSLKPKKEKPERQSIEITKEKRRAYAQNKLKTMTEDQLKALRASEKKRRDKNKEKLKIYKAKYQIENKARLNKISNDYRENHKEERKIYLKSYNERRRTLSKQKRLNDPLHRFKEILRAGVYRAFQSKGWGKTGHSALILGCDFETAKAHIEKQFTKGMTWDKIGSEIHIDHKIPISSAKTEEEVRHLCHYRNLQPLWKLDNLVKSSNIVPTQIHLAI